MQRTLPRLLQASTSRQAAAPLGRERRLSYNESMQPSFDLTNLMKEPSRVDDAGTSHHLALERERQRRHYARLVAFQLPELAKRYQNNFTPPPTDALQLRVLDYFGEPHPANGKVVLTLSIPLLHLSKEEGHKFRLLAGPRWDSEQDTLKMACDKFGTREENAKWCDETLARLVAEAKHPDLKLSDIPLDDRHTKAKLRKKPKSRHVSLRDFPKAWLSPAKDVERIEKGEHKVIEGMVEQTTETEASIAA